MLPRIKNYFYRNRPKFIIGGIFVGSAFLMTKYAKKLLREWQEKEAKELLERARKHQHYESIEKTCNHTALTLTSTLRETIIKLLKVEELVEQLHTGVPNKVVIWERLKILAFTKLVALVYASSILIITLRIQLSLIGGYMFHDAKEHEENKITSSVQEKYLGLCQFFIDEGIKNLCEFLEEKVNIILKDKSLKEKLSIQDIEQIFWAIQTSINNDKRDPCKSLSSYILPKNLLKNSYGPSRPVFDNIIVETNDILESEEIIHLIRSCISHGFCHVTDKIAQFFKDKIYLEQESKNKSSSVPTSSSALDNECFVNIYTLTIPMAKIIPIVNDLIQNHANKDDTPYTWIQQLILMDALKVMGANIYETFSSKG